MSEQRGFRSIPKVALVLCTLVALFLYTWSCSTPPSDAALLRNFKNAKPQLEALRDMLKQDSQLTAVAKYGIATTNMALPARPAEIGFPLARYNRYLELMKRAHVTVTVRDEADLRFLTHSGGCANRGWRTAITWRESRPTNLLSNLDLFRKQSISWADAYRHVEDNWYIWIIW